MDNVLNLGLQPGGADVEKNQFHCLQAYPGQEERSGVYDYGSELILQMNLVEVVHGTMDESPNSLPATLIIADFHFNSLSASRRFRRATVELRFRDLSPNDANPPEVVGIAPEGTFRMNKTERIQELKRAAKADVGVALVANVTTGVEWSLTDTETKYSSAKLTGIRHMKYRKIEPQNVATWSMHENERDDNGIPSLLRTAILLRRKTNEQFHGAVIVNAKVDWKTRINLESRIAGGDINPVLFNPSRKRLTPVPTYIDEKNLGRTQLSKLSAVQSHTAMETVVTTQSNTLSDGHISGLTLDGVMGKLEHPVPKLANQQVSTSAVGGETHMAEKVDNPASNPVGRQVVSTSTLQNEPQTTKKLLEPVLKSLDGQVSGVTLDNVVRTTQTKSEEHVQPSDAKFGPARSTMGSREPSNLEETMHLLLHAVRKGVEVIAEAASPSFPVWPKIHLACLQVLIGIESDKVGVLA